MTVQKSLFYRESLLDMEQSSGQELLSSMDDERPKTQNLAVLGTITPIIFFGSFHIAKGL